MRVSRLVPLIGDFCNNIGTTRTKANAAQCPQLVGADISPKSVDSRFDPDRTSDVQCSRLLGSEWLAHPVTDHGKRRCNTGFTQKGGGKGR
jgi:hypothetical protein